MQPREHKVRLGGVMDPHVRVNCCDLGVGAASTEPPCGGGRAALGVSEEKLCDGVVVEIYSVQTLV